MDTAVSHEVVHTDYQIEIESGMVTSACAPCSLPSSGPPCQDESAAPGGGQEAVVFECPVCTERTAVVEMVLLTACGDPAHGICPQCAFTYINGRIKEMRVEELFCAMGVAAGGCAGLRAPAMALEEEVVPILSAVDDAATERYFRFKRMKADRALCTCPGCGQLCPPNLEGGQLQSKVTCEACGASFCYWHAWAHERETCHVYEARLQQEEKEIAQLFKTRKCPGCTWQTEKTGGCNHMTCRQCTSSWCWSCGKRIEGIASLHFSSDNAASNCRQFDGEPTWDEGEAPSPTLEGRIVSWLRGCGRCFGKFLMIVVDISWVTFSVLFMLLGLPLWLMYCFVGCLRCCAAYMHPQAGQHLSEGPADYLMTVIGIVVKMAIPLGLLVSVLLMLLVVAAWSILVCCILLPMGHCQNYRQLFEIMATPFERIIEFWDVRGHHM